MQKELWLVRHGSTEWTSSGRFIGWHDPPLNADGRKQARELRQHLAGIRFAGVWSSDLCRAVETARLAHGEPRIDNRIRELAFGDLEGRTWDDLDESTQQALAAFDGFRAPGGESVQELAARVDDFAGELSGGRHLVFSHGGVLRLLLRRTGKDRWVPPCQIITVSWPAG